MGQENVLCTIHGWQVRLLLQSRTKWAAGGEEGGCLMTAQRARLACIRPETQILRRDHRILGLLMLHQLVIQDSFGRVSTILLRPQEGRKPEINRHTKDLQKQQNRAEISFTDATGRRHIYPCCVIHLSWNSQLRMARNKV